MERTFPVFYKVRFYDEIENETRTVAGVTFATSTIDLMNKLARYYGELEIEAASFSFGEENPVLEIPRNELFEECLATFDIELV